MFRMTDWLDRLIPSAVPYPIKGGIMRGIRTLLAMVLAGIATSLADGTLIASIKVIPAAYAPMVVIILGAVLAAIDKFLRERGLLEAQDHTDPEGLPVTDPVTEEETADDPVVVNDPVLTTTDSLTGTTKDTV
jgi:hypothetical protein